VFDNANPQARFRVDGMPIEHAQYATGHTGPVSWITSGKLDAVLDIKFPFHPDEQVDIRDIFDQIGRNVGRISQGDHPDSPGAPAMATGGGDADEQAAAVSLSRKAVTVLPEREMYLTSPDVERAREQAAALEAASPAPALAESADTAAASASASASAGPKSGINPGASRLARPPLRAPGGGAVEDGAMDEVKARQVTIDIDLRFRDLKAAVPLYTTDLSVANNALIRPIVAFIK
jgi:distribution and morphology protein 31